MKQPSLFDQEMVLAQLRYAGMMETIRIRKLGYPIRQEFDNFLSRYKLLSRVQPTADAKAGCKSLLADLKAKGIADETEIQVGLTKIFMRDGQFSKLEDSRNAALSTSLSVIQKWARGYVARKRIIKMKIVALKLQSFARMRKHRKWWESTSESTVTLQAWFRGMKARRNIKRTKSSAIVVQKWAKGCKARKTIRRLKAMAAEEERKRIEMEKAAAAEKVRLQREAEERKKKEELRVKAELEAKEKAEREEAERRRIEEERLAGEQRQQKMVEMQEMGMAAEFNSAVQLFENTGENSGYDFFDLPPPEEDFDLPPPETMDFPPPPMSQYGSQPRLSQYPLQPEHPSLTRSVYGASSYQPPPPENGTWFITTPIPRIATCIPV